MNKFSKKNSNKRNMTTNKRNQDIGQSRKKRRNWYMQFGNDANQKIKGVANDNDQL